MGSLAQEKKKKREREGGLIILGECRDEGPIKQKWSGLGLTLNDVGRPRHWLMVTREKRVGGEKGGGVEEGG